MTDLFVLGAPDPEMAAIESLLTTAGKTVVHAMMDGRRVHPGNAYVAPMPAQWTDAGRIVLVECVGTLPDGIGDDQDVLCIDHHRLGDPGFGVSPQNFLRASSLGQIIGLLAAQDALPADWTRTRSENFPIVRAGQTAPGSSSDAGFWAVGLPDEPSVIGEDVGGQPVSAGWPKAVIPETVVVIAAADHCLPAAYRGECPGVDPGALLAWRMMSRAAFQGRTVHEVEADVATARAALASAPALLVPKHPGIDDGASWLAIDWERVGVMDCGIRDMRGAVVPELPEAAARDGICFVSLLPPTGREPRTKVVCQAGTPEQITAFQRWAAAQGLSGMYGDPARGFAGGYMAATAAA